MHVLYNKDACVIKSGDVNQTFQEHLNLDDEVHHLTFDLHMLTKLSMNSSVN